MARYVTALSAGDFDGAMRERCAKSRITADNRELFISQTRDLFRMTTITGAEVSPYHRITVTAADESKTPIPFDYTVLTSTGRLGTLHGVAVIEDGQLRLCGYAQANVDRFLRTLSASVASGPAVSRSPRDLMPAQPPVGYHQVDDGQGPLSVDAGAGQGESWTRKWQRENYGGALVTAVRYSTSQVASDALTAAAKKYIGDATEAFTVDGVPNALAFRYATIAWTWVQPPDAGYQGDAIFTLDDNTVIVVIVSGLLPTESHADATSLAQQVADLTG